MRPRLPTLLSSANPHALSPYVRLLYALGVSSVAAGRLDLTVHAFEEIMRIRRLADCVADPLLFAYLAVVGCARRGISPGVRRSWEHVRALVAHVRAHGHKSGLVLWCDVLERFAGGDDSWRELAAPHARAVMAGISGAGEIIDLTRDWMVYLFQNWPDFVLECHAMGRLPVDVELARQLLETEPNVVHRFRRGDRRQYALSALAAADGEEGLDPEAVMASQNLWARANPPGDRWWLNVPSSILIGFTRAMFAGALVGDGRIYLRIALCSRSCDPWWHAHVIDVAEYVEAPALATHTREMAEKAKQGLTTKQAAHMAKTACAMLSLTGIAWLAEGQMTEERLSYLIKVGVEDFHTPVNMPVAMLPLLPWLSDGDCDL
jgi:hypothetical protein